MGASRRNLCPFVPGIGAPPPELAGRHDIQARLRNRIEYLLAGKAPPGPVILMGPRGNGKTTLTQWLVGEADGLGIESIWMTANTLVDPQRNSNLLFRPSETKSRYERKEIRQYEGEFGLPFLKGKSGMIEETVLPADGLWDAVDKRLSEGPLLLIVDEAHVLHGDAGRTLLDIALTSTANRPLLVVLAGTPRLKDSLSALDASFWPRSEIIGVGRIDDAACRHAIEKPLRSEDVDLGLEEDSALLWRKIVDEAQGYPYFCQLIGAALWDELEAGSEWPSRATRVLLDAQSVEQALIRFNSRRLEYYEGRYAEIASPELLRAAVCVAKSFVGAVTEKGGPRVPVRQIESAVEEALDGDFGKRVEALRVLSDLGFFWHQPSIEQGTTPHYEPGIPSLMGYVLEQVKS